MAKCGRALVVHVPRLQDPQSANKLAVATDEHRETLRLLWHAPMPRFLDLGSIPLAGVLDLGVRPNPRNSSFIALKSIVGWMSSPRAGRAESASAANTPNRWIGLMEGYTGLRPVERLTDADRSKRVYAVHDSRFVPPKQSSRNAKSS